MSFALPPPPLGLVAAAGPALGGLPQPPPPSMRHMMVGVPPGAMMKRPLQVLLTNVPPFLHGARPMRSWALAGGGGVRSIVMVPPPPILKPGETLPLSSDQTGTRISALLTMSHADAALKVITAFRHFQQKLKDEGKDNEYLNFTAHSVPTNPDIPLPPAVMDKETVTVLGDKLYEAFQQLKDGKETDQQASANLSTVIDNSGNAEITTSMDVSTNNAPRSSTAEDGGDEGDDPLTTPTILEAVRKFREQLSLQQGSKATRRQQLVKEAIEKALPVVRQRLQEERTAPPSAVPVIPGLPPPPDAGLPLPPPPPPMAPPMAGGPRGVSNKPAWMTQQEQQPHDTTEEPAAKKVKLDLIDSTIVFSAVRTESVGILRDFVAEKIRQYLGQEEADLIDFVHKHVLEQKSVSALQSDLADVLDEDAPAFLQAIYEKSQELS